MLPAGLSVSCTHEPAGIEDLDPVCFDTQILPILQTSCGISGCHDGSAEEFQISDYNSIMEIVTPGDPHGSKLYRVITSINGENLMPPKNPLTREQRTLIQLWIAQGAKNTICGTGDGSGSGGGSNADSVCFVQDVLPVIPPAACDTTGTISFSTQVFPILQANCIGCHNNSSANGGVNLSSYSQVKTIAETLRSGTPLLQGTIRRMQGFVAMPQTFALDECSIRKIELWIAQGVQNN